MEVVIRENEPFNRSVRFIKTSHQVLENPFHPLTHQAVVIHMPFIIYIIHDDIVRPLLLFPDSPGILSEPQRHKTYPVRGQEFTGRPVSQFKTAPVIVNKPFVILQLCLTGGQQFLCFLFGLPDKQHKF